MDKVTKEH